MSEDEALVERTARACHAVIMEIQRDAGDPAPSQPWECETEETRESARAGVRYVLAENPAPRQMFEHWRDSKIADGWTRGPKDPVAKTHPNIVDYAGLPEAERVKDAVFIAVVNAMRPGGQRMSPVADRSESVLEAMARAAYEAHMRAVGLTPLAGDIEWHAWIAAARAVCAIDSEMARALEPRAELAALRELTEEVGVMAANAPEDGDSFAVCEQIAMRIAAFGVPAEPDDGRHPDGHDCQFCREDERTERDRDDRIEAAEEAEFLRDAASLDTDFEEDL